VVLVFAVTAARVDADDPLSAMALGERPEPVAPDGWVTVTVRAAALNHHDVWSLRGRGIAVDRLPLVLGCDASGIDPDGNEVVVHAVIADPDAGGGDETLDPRRSLLSERYDGTFAERVAVPRRNLVPKPKALSFEEAACLPTAYLTAYKMLFEKSGAQPGATLLVQGAGGGVATALIVLGRAAGYRIWATSRSEAKRDRAVKLGADQAFPPGTRLPERVDAVMETVGQATWPHSVRSLRPGGRIVICGATSGDAPPAELTRIFFTQLSVVGSTMGTRDQLARLAMFCEQTGVRPLIDGVLPLRQARDGFAAMIEGNLFGKIVFVVLGRADGPRDPRCVNSPGALCAGRRVIRRRAAYPRGESSVPPVGSPGSSRPGVSAASGWLASRRAAVSWAEPKISVLMRSSASSRIVRRSLMTFSPAVLDCVASLRRSEVNCKATRSRSRSVPMSSGPGQPRRPRTRAQSSQPRRPGQSVHPVQPGGSQSCSPPRNRAPASSRIRSQAPRDPEKPDDSSRARCASSRSRRACSRTRRAASCPSVSARL
jgi:NADPH:quinone reductase-like Zn-dependent oxidoreductase